MNEMKIRKTVRDQEDPEEEVYLFVRNDVDSLNISSSSSPQSDKSKLIKFVFDTDRVTVIIILVFC